MLVVSIYDMLAVRFGFMQWLVKRLSEAATLPAFVIPKSISGWNLNLNEVGIKKLMGDESTERKFSVLGRGNIGCHFC